MTYDDSNFNCLFLCNRFYYRMVIVIAIVSAVPLHSSRAFDIIYSFSNLISPLTVQQWHVWNMFSRSIYLFWWRRFDGYSAKLFANRNAVITRNVNCVCKMCDPIPSIDRIYTWSGRCWVGRLEMDANRFACNNDGNQNHKSGSVCLNDNKRNRLAVFHAHALISRLSGAAHFSAANH